MTLGEARNIIDGLSQLKSYSHQLSTEEGKALLRSLAAEKAEKERKKLEAKR